MPKPELPLSLVHRLTNIEIKDGALDWTCYCGQDNTSALSKDVLRCENCGLQVQAAFFVALTPIREEGKG